MDIMKIYDILPVFLQNMACTFEGIRVKHNKYGRRQKKSLPAFMERNNWSYDQKCEYRDRQLQIMVEHCYHHVPYYHNLFDSLGIDYREIQTLDDLKVLPILTKETVRENISDLLADNVPKSERMAMHTSGSTGSGLQFYYSKSAYADQWADSQRHNYNLGLTGKEWKAYFCGRSIVPKGKNVPPFYRINYAMKEYMFSAFHLKRENFDSYIKGLEERELEVWHGYPSSILSLAQYMLDTGIRLSYVPKLILLSSENVSQTALDKMEMAFGIRPLQGYSLTEQVATIRQFRDGRMFVMEDLSAVELVPVDETGLCRVVGTTLTNFVMPFLRYDTRDLVTYQETAEGREILSIDGRVEDTIKLADGGTIKRLDHIFKDQINIAETQIIQKSYEMLEFRIVKGANYTEADEAVLYEDIRAYLSGRIDFRIVYVNAIPKGKNGKLKFIVSEIQ